jgi:hypothetical protein
LTPLCFLIGVRGGCGWLLYVGVQHLDSERSRSFLVIAADAAKTQIWTGLIAMLILN